MCAGTLLSLPSCAGYSRPADWIGGKSLERPFCERSQAILLGQRPICMDVRSKQLILLLILEELKECVYFSDNSSYSLSTISCDEKLVLISLICQRSTRRIHFGSEMESYRFPLSSKWTRTQIKYPQEQCEYFTFVRQDFNSSIGIKPKLIVKL